MKPVSLNQTKGIRTMSNPLNVLTSLFHRPGVAGCDCSRAFDGSGGRSRSVAAVFAACLCAALCVGAVGASGASALQFGEEGHGAGQFKESRGLVVDHLTGDVYVVDKNNRRIDEFEANGTFVRAWGWEVDAAKPEAKLQECTTATGCQQGEGGGGAGELNKPVGIAVSSELGKEAVYVLEEGQPEGGNDRVQEFGPEGKFVRMWGGKVNKKTGGNVCPASEAAECQAGTEGAGKEEFEIPGLQGAIAVGPTGSVYVGDLGRVQRFSSEGAWESSFNTSIDNTVQAVAVTSAGKVCVTINSVSSPAAEETPAPEVFCYPPTGGSPEHTLVLSEQPSSGLPYASIWSATDGSGHLFVDEWLYENTNHESQTQIVTEYNASFAQVGLFAPPGRAPGNEYRPGGLALPEVSNAASEVLVVASENGIEAVYGGPVPLPLPHIIGEEATPEGGGTVTFKASINPLGERTKYHFEYGTEVANETATPAATMVAEGTTPETVEVKVAGLTPFVTYHFHVVAENGAGKVEGKDGTFVAIPAVSIDSLSAGDVTAESATLEALLNPHGADTHYRFEYAPLGSSDYEKTPEADAGAGMTDTPVSAHIQKLEPDTTYTYRVVAVNRFSEEHPEAVQHVEPRQFTTQRAGAPFALLDGRAWEQVSPSSKANATIGLFDHGSGPLQSAPGGEALTYLTQGSPESAPAGEVLSAQVVSRHGAGGWSSRDITPPTLHRANNKIGEAGDYWLFSENLERSVIDPSPYTPLSEWTSERTQYLRDEAKCAVVPPLVAGSECFVPLVTNKPGPFDDVKEGVEFGGPLGGQLGNVNAVDATPDLSHIVVNTRAPLELVEGAGVDSLYEWSAGKLTPLEITPAGAPWNGVPCSGIVGLGVPGGGSNLGIDSRNALSSDGSLAVFTGEGPCQGHLFIRDVANKESVQLDEVQPGASGGSEPAGAYYEDASVGDEHVFFTDSQHLTENSTGARGGTEKRAADLYEYHLDRTTDTGQLTDMTVPVNAGEAAGVRGVLGASEDGAYVYFVANGVLSTNENAHGEKAKPGNCGAKEGLDENTSALCNLYVAHYDGSGWERPVFIATLSSKDGHDWGEASAGGPDDVASQTARVSPNGKWLAFMSERSLTGYDNEDVTSLKPGERLDEEVFLYDANTHKTICASCDPTGARPTGVFRPGESFGKTAEPLFDGEQRWKLRWIAGVIPGPYAIGIEGELGLRQPRYLSNGGRLFFDSTDGLVPSDRNGVTDAYEYEPPTNSETIADGANDTCAAGAATYSASTEGCVDLISSGTSPEESVFLEASENGNDVFFLTAEKLAASDTDSAYDVYDAHVCGSGWECPSVPAVSPPCAGAESCRSAPAAQPSIYGDPSSATFVGAGNIAPAAPVVTKKVVTKKTVKCNKGFVKNKKNKCVKKPKKKAKRASRDRRGK